MLGRPFYPDPAIPEHVKRATLAGLEDGTSAHYTMPIGNMELKMELAKKLKAFNHLDVDPERNIIITPGSDAGLMFAMMPFIDPGDEVMVPDPQLSKQLPERQNPRRCNGAGPPAGGERIPTGDRGVRKTPDAKHQNDCPYQPNNPTTTVMRRESLEKLAQFAVKNDLIVVCDQAFEDSVYDGVEFVTLASLPGMWERTVTVCSISKGMALSGYRVLTSWRTTTSWMCTMAAP